uniref:ABC-type dipeptide/oligopeptide/nickel transport system, ATPase component n=1 Tax=Candidatus Actinomarina minuta TaxID=1389454 RepID=S5DMX1_9ACTN|nr:ABC-type dipeptide/oligopeptide/nickel transport system, ATPase component [Candidatus Actinomarina minuta]|tara:strand:- start:206 stop:1183 length:978 start_codon:yes stop_codon:yes gene_type:complete
MSEILLEVKNLSMHYDTLEGNVEAVKNVSFNVNSGESFGLVGESGCGKTSVAMTLLQLQPENSIITEGSIKLDGKELIGLSENDLRKVRWDSISIVFQGAMNAWNPVIKIGEQIREAMREHYPQNSKQENINKINELFRMVGLDESISERFPHELSGGMKQRAVIALALSCDPKIIIADEPTTALDVVIQDQILNEIKKVQDLLGLSLIYISHDIAVIAEMTDKIAVMYAGSIVEMGPTKNVFTYPKHSYTRALLDSTPSIKGEKKKLRSLDGEPPSLIDKIDGCSFAPRCPDREISCNPTEHMTLIEIDTDHYVDICSQGKMQK